MFTYVPLLVFKRNEPVLPLCGRLWHGHSMEPESRSKVKNVYFFTSIQRQWETVLLGIDKVKNKYRASVGQEKLDVLYIESEASEIINKFADEKARKILFSLQVIGTLYILLSLSLFKLFSSKYVTFIMLVLNLFFHLQIFLFC